VDQGVVLSVVQEVQAQLQEEVLAEEMAGKVETPTERAAALGDMLIMVGQAVEDKLVLLQVTVLQGLAVVVAAVVVS
jgi:hypothetical protein